VEQIQNDSISKLKKKKGRFPKNFPPFDTGNPMAENNDLDVD
jgi:hypothetical protein